MRLHLIQPRELFGPPERQEELLTCWYNNDHAGFDKIITPDGRPSFNELFDLCSPDAINVIANADIYFDAESLAYINEIQQGECWALSRWDIVNGRPFLWDHADSQDVWIFHGLPNGIDAPYPMGIPGCDNNLAFLIDQAGYAIRNPSRTVRAYHLHAFPWRSYLHNKNARPRGAVKSRRIAPPYKLVKPTEI